MSMLLLDLGNTRLKLAAVTASNGADPAGPTPADARALVHGRPGFDTDLAAALDAMPHASGALFASVGPPELAARIDAALAARGIAVERCSVVAQRADLRVCYPQPQQFGVDRWLGLIGARRHAGAGPALLVASCGTALTVDLLDADGTHLGGVIAPGPALMASALRSRATHLPDAGFANDAAFANAPISAYDPASASTPGFACDTVAAIAAGCQGAAAGLLQRCIATARARVQDLRVLLTGGGAPPLQALLAASDHAPCAPSYHPWLVLDGLAQLAHERASLR